jgi:dipeptidase E
MNLLLFSNSTNAGEQYLDYTQNYIQEFFNNKPLDGGIFIPYAGVSISYDKYAEKVTSVFNNLGLGLKSIHQFEEPIKAVEEATYIVVGGGNTFHLLKCLIDNNLIDPIRKKILEGIPYIGWSAGSNVTCPTIKTTNDMPIVELPHFKALNLIPFQINPHYTDKNPDGHAGETREDRIEEFLIANPEMYVVGLREGTLLSYKENRLRLKGEKTARIFKSEMQPIELGHNDNFEFLLK